MLHTSTRTSAMSAMRTPACRSWRMHTAAPQRGLAVSRRTAVQATPSRRPQKEQRSSAAPVGKHVPKLGPDGQPRPTRDERRRSDLRIYEQSGIPGPALAMMKLLREREGSVVVDVVQEEAIPSACRAFALLAETARTELGRDITIQPFGPKEPLGFSIALSALPTLAERPPASMRVSARTEPKKLGLYLLKHVVMDRNPVVIECTGRASITVAMMGMGALRARINWEDAEDDFYCTVLSAVTSKPGERPPPEGVQNEPGKQNFVAILYSVALFPCARLKDGKPREKRPTKAEAAPARGAEEAQ